jgi:hypothetical protein
MRLYVLTVKPYWNTPIRDWNNVGTKRTNPPVGYVLFIVTDLRCALRFVVSCGFLVLALHCEHPLIGFDISFMTEMVLNLERKAERSLTSDTLISLLSSLFVYNLNEMSTAADTWVICSSNHLKLKFNIL